MRVVERDVGCGGEGGERGGVDVNGCKKGLCVGERVKKWDLKYKAPAGVT